MLCVVPVYLGYLARILGSGLSGLSTRRDIPREEEISLPSKNSGYASAGIAAETRSSANGARGVLPAETFEMRRAVALCWKNGGGAKACERQDQAALSPWRPYSQRFLRAPPRYRSHLTIKAEPRIHHERIPESEVPKELGLAMVHEEQDSRKMRHLRPG